MNVSEEIQCVSNHNVWIPDSILQLHMVESDWAELPLSKDPISRYPFGGGGRVMVDKNTLAQSFLEKNLLIDL